MRGKTLLIIGAGREQVPGIELAKKLGLHVVVTDGNAQAPGFAYADAGATVDTYDARGQASFAKAYNKKRKITGKVVEWFTNTDIRNDIAKSKGFIESHRTHNTGIGKTFEDVIGIVENNSSLADYHKILEIKSKRDLIKLVGVNPKIACTFLLQPISL